MKANFYLSIEVDVLARQFRLTMNSCNCLYMLERTRIIKYNLKILCIMSFHTFIILSLQSDQLEQEKKCYTNI